MKNTAEKLVPCPIARSSNNDTYNDICSATGKTCPFFVDEGMSVCKNKAKCLGYFAKKGTDVNPKEVIKLIFSDTKSGAGVKSEYTNTIKRDRHMQREEKVESNLDANQFMEELDAALQSHEMSSKEDGER